MARNTPTVSEDLHGEVYALREEVERLTERLECLERAEADRQETQRTERMMAEACYQSERRFAAAAKQEI